MKIEYKSNRVGLDFGRGIYNNFVPSLVAQLFARPQLKKREKSFKKVLKHPLPNTVLKFFVIFSVDVHASPAPPISINNVDVSFQFMQEEFACPIGIPYWLA